MLTHAPLFFRHSLTVTEFNNAITVQPAVWPVLILCVVLFLLAIIMAFRRNWFVLIEKSLFSQRFYSLLLQDGKIFRKPIFILVIVCDILVFVSAFRFVAQHFEMGLFSRLREAAALGLLFAAIAVLYFFKLVINHLYAVLFDYQEEAYPMNLYKFAFITNAAVLLLPFLTVAQFSHIFPVIYAYIPVFIVLFIIYIYKLIVLNPKRINLFQFFIYFCTLEILPYPLLVKLIIMI